MGGSYLIQIVVYGLWNGSHLTSSSWVLKSGFGSPLNPKSLDIESKLSFTGLTKIIIKGLATFPSEIENVKENNISIVKDLLQSISIWPR